MEENKKIVSQRKNVTERKIEPRKKLTVALVHLFRQANEVGRQENKGGS